MTSDQNKIYDAAFKFKAEGRFLESIDEFKRIGEDGSDVKLISNLMIALTYRYGVEDAEMALKYARKAVEDRPESERASLCLVHCLIDTNSKNEIDNEIRRYLKSGGEINEYHVLLEENGLEVSDFS